MPTRRQRGERSCETPVVSAEVRRELPENGTELGRPGQRLEPLVVALDAAGEIRQPPDVRQVAAGLDGEHEPRRRLLDPPRDRCLQREPVEGVVDLDGVELLRVVLQPEPRRLAFVELVLP